MKKFNEFLKESSVTPEDVARKIVSILDNNFPNQIRVKHDSNLLSLSFDVIGPVTRGEIAKPGDHGTKNRSLAKKLASQIVSSLKTIIKLEDSSIESDDRDAYVNLFMVSDSFIGMPDLKRPRGVAIVNERCWDGYKPTPGKKPYEKGSCMKEGEDDIQEDAEHEGKKVTLNKPFRTPDGPKKFAVYVKNDKGNVVKVTFGDPDMEIKRDSDSKRSNFRARHNCDDPGPKWKARYWSCKMWSNKPVSKLTESPAEIFHSFDILDGPRTKKLVGGVVNLRGHNPEDAIKQYLIPYGYRKFDIKTKPDGVIDVKIQWGSNPKDTESVYYRLRSVNEAVDVSQAAKLFNKFIRTTGAPEKVSNFVPDKSASGRPVFTGSSANSKFTYVIDVESGTIEASSNVTADRFVWNKKDNKVRVVESRINEKDKDV